MLGMLRNDLFALKKQFIVAAITAALFLTLGLLICGSFRFGNLAKLPEEDFFGVRSTMTTLFGPISAAFICMANPIAGVTFTNRQSGWYTFLYASPVSERTTALLHLLERVGYTLACAVFGLISTFGCYGLAGCEITPTDIFAMLMGVLLASFVALLPTSYLVKSVNAEVLIRIILIFAISSEITVVFVSSPPAKAERLLNEAIETLPQICLVLLAVNIVVFFVSWWISTNVLKKRKL